MLSTRCRYTECSNLFYLECSIGLGSGVWSGLGLGSREGPGSKDGHVGVLKAGYKEGLETDLVLENCVTPGVRGSFAVLGGLGLGSGLKPVIARVQAMIRVEARVWVRLRVRHIVVCPIPATRGGRTSIASVSCSVQIISIIKFTLGQRGRSRCRLELGLGSGLKSSLGTGSGLKLGLGLKLRLDSQG